MIAAALEAEIAAALEAEVEQYLERLRDERDEQGRAVAVRNGRARERKVTLGAGTIAIRAPQDTRQDEELVDGEGISATLIVPIAVDINDKSVSQVFALQPRVGAGGNHALGYLGFQLGRHALPHW